MSSIAFTPSAVRIRQASHLWCSQKHFRTYRQIRKPSATFGTLTGSPTCTFVPRVSQDPSNKSICCFLLRISVGKVIKLCSGTPHSITLIKNLYKIPNEPVPGEDPQWLTMTSSSSPVSASLGTFPAAPLCHLEVLYDSEHWIFRLQSALRKESLFSKRHHATEDTQRLNATGILPVTDKIVKPAAPN